MVLAGQGLAEPTYEGSYGGERSSQARDPTAPDRGHAYAQAA